MVPETPRASVFLRDRFERREALYIRPHWRVPKPRLNPIVNNAARGVRIVLFAPPSQTKMFSAVTWCWFPYPAPASRSVPAAMRTDPSPVKC